MAITRFDVFSPNSFPQYNYVARTFLNKRTQKPRDPEAEMAETLKRTNAILLVTGPSKSGKTIALEQVISQARIIKLTGSRVTSPEALWNSAIAQLRLPMHRGSEVKTGTATATEKGAHVKAEIFGIGPGVEGKEKQEKKIESSDQTAFEHDLFQTATEGLKSRDMVLLVDDFHTMPRAVQPAVASQLKEAAERGVRICLAEVPHRADEAIIANPDLTGRVVPVEFEYWSEGDLKKIGKVGFEQLNVRIADSTLVALAAEAAGSPQLMQSLCLEAAKVMGVDECLPEPLSLAMDQESLEVVFINVVQEIDRDAVFSILDKGPSERGKQRNVYPAPALSKGFGDNYELTLAAIALDPPMLSLTWDESADNLQYRIARISPDDSKRPHREQITRALFQMTVLAAKHSPRLALMDWDVQKGLHILDPYFLFYLRWSEKYLPVRRAAPA